MLICFAFFLMCLFPKFYLSKVKFIAIMFSLYLWLQNIIYLYYFSDIEKKLFRSEFHNVQILTWLTIVTLRLFNIFRKIVLS
jgi:hypothetical protein